jgi:hypothetical protein
LSQKLPPGPLTTPGGADPQDSAAAIKRLKEGDPKFPGANIIARVHELGTGKGFTFWETDDPVAASRYGLA